MNDDTTPAHPALADPNAMSESTQGELTAWAEGYRWALVNAGDEAVEADRARYLSEDEPPREARWQKKAAQLLAYEPKSTSFLPDGLISGDIALFAGSAGELSRGEISGKVFFARMADRLNAAKAEALREAAGQIGGQGIVGAGAHDSSVRFGFERGLGVAVNILRTTADRLGGKPGRDRAGEGAGS